jgi:hypothetical protein
MRILILKNSQICGPQRENTVSPAVDYNDDGQRAQTTKSTAEVIIKHWIKKLKEYYIFISILQKI